MTKERVSGSTQGRCERAFSLEFLPRAPASSLSVPNSLARRFSIAAKKLELVYWPYEPQNSGAYFLSRRGEVRTRLKIAATLRRNLKILVLFQNWNQLIAGRFGTIKLPGVRLKNSGEKFTKEFGLVCTFLKNWKKIGTN